MSLSPSHGSSSTRTTVLGQPSNADLMRQIELLQQSVAAMGRYIEMQMGTACPCPECEGKSFDATGWGD